MFEIKEVTKVEATGSFWGSLISCAGTWLGTFMLWAAAAC